MKAAVIVGMVLIVLLGRAWAESCDWRSQYSSNPQAYCDYEKRFKEKDAWARRQNLPYRCEALYNDPEAGIHGLNTPTIQCFDAKTGMYTIIR